jgi:hypothetical protein
MSTNPFDDGQNQTTYRYDETTTATTAASTTTSSSPIFSARGVEWPLPMAFNPTQYRKWRRESRDLGSSLGILSSGLRISIGNTNSSDNSGAGASAIGGAKYMGGSAFATSSSEIFSAAGGGGSASSSALGNVVVGGADGGRGGGSLESQSTGGGGGGGYGGLTGLMGRVLGASSHPTSGMQGASFLSKCVHLSSIDC